MAEAAPAVRRTVAGDWAALRVVRLRALAQDPDAFGSTYERALAVPDDEYRRRAAAGATHLAWSGGEPVGIVTLVPQDDPAHGELTSTWVDPRHRGTGLAQRLVEAACAQGRIDGGRQVTLWVMTDGERARRLYERCGFVLTGVRQPAPSGQPVRPDRPERLEEQMRRSLTAPPGEGPHALTRPDGVSGAEMLVELGHLLAEDGQEPAHVDGAFVLHRYLGETYDPPLLLHLANADRLLHLVDQDAASSPWPDATPERAALNLFLVHLDEAVATRHDEARRHVVLVPYGLVCVTDLAVPDEPPALPPRIEVPEGATLVWTTGEPGAEGPPPPTDGGPRQGAGTGQQMFVLRALLGAEQAYERGHLLDETLQLVQDQVSTVIGPRALSRFGDQIRRLAPPDGDLDVILADPVLCQQMLRGLLADG